MTKANAPHSYNYNLVLVSFDWESPYSNGAREIKKKKEDKMNGG